LTRRTAAGFATRHPDPGVRGGRFDVFVISGARKPARNLLCTRWYTNESTKTLHGSDADFADPVPPDPVRLARCLP